MSEEYLKEMNSSLRRQKLSKCQECKRAKLTRTRVKTNLTRTKVKQKKEKITETEAGEHIAIK
jgi:argonaute-like protein implicated in RNA metabolism and viral defense